MRFGDHISGLGAKLSARMAEWRSRPARARYFRGHGVHSPFVYALVREVFMRRDLLPGRRDLYEALLASDISRRRAVQLQNLAIHCGYASFGMNRADSDLCILTRELPQVQMLGVLAAAARAGHTVAILSPYDGCERWALCRRIVETHHSTTVDNRAYILIFNNHLPKQHFRL